MDITLRTMLRATHEHLEDAIDECATFPVDVSKLIKILECAGMSNAKAGEYVRRKGGTQ